MNNTALLRLQVRVQQAWIKVRDNEQGQTMIEYAGIALVAAAIIIALIALAQGKEGQDLGKAVIGKISEAIGKIKLGGE